MAAPTPWRSAPDCHEGEVWIPNRFFGGSRLAMKTCFPLNCTQSTCARAQTENLTAWLESRHTSGQGKHSQEAWLFYLTHSHRPLFICLFCTGRSRVEAKHSHFHSRVRQNSISFSSAVK